MYHNRIIINISFTILTFAIFSYFYIDRLLAVYFHNIHNILIVTIFHYITKIGEAQYILIPLILLFMFNYKKTPLFAYKMLYLFSAVAVSGIIADIIKIIAARERPAMLFEHDAYGFIWFKLGSLFNSFPSGHSATSWSLFIGLSLLFPKQKVLFLTLAFLVSTSRIVLNFHYLSDVLIGSLIGGLIALFIYQKYILTDNCNKFQTSV